MPGIGDLDNGPRLLLASRDRDRARILDGLYGIRQQIHEHLVDLADETLRVWQRCVIANDLDAVPQQMLDERQRTIDAEVQVDELQFGLVEVGEVLERLHDGAHAISRLERRLRGLHYRPQRSPNTRIALQAVGE